MPSIPRTLLGALLSATTALAAAADIDVMTQNQYLGADLAPALTAGSPEAFNAAVVAALRQIAANRPAERVRALAAQIAWRRPDVVGLQEAYRFACLPAEPEPAAGTGCDDPSIRAAFTDHLADTVRALHGSYRLVGRVTNFEIPQLPFVIDGHPAVLALADRDAILVAAGVPARPVDFAAFGLCGRPSDQGCNYTEPSQPLPTAVGSIDLRRGFLAVDVRVHGRPYRVVNTHLEQKDIPPLRLLQVAQALQLRATLQAAPPHGRLIVLGDLNADPRDQLDGLPTPYQTFVAAPYGGTFTDLWLLRAHPDDGFGCCQSEDLSDRHWNATERIDLILSQDAPRRVSRVQLIGDGAGEPRGRPGPGPRWPSDHASLAATLHFDD